jgi:hypothetical protein
MAEKLVYESEMPVTQTIDSGNALASFLGMKEELPEIIALANGARLTLSSKRDCYYYTSSTGCTCKAGTYGRICRHRKATEGTKGLFAKPSVSFNLPVEDQYRQESCLGGQKDVLGYQ